MGDDDLLVWVRQSALVETSDQGHAVSASKGADGWRFAAWTPLESPELKYWDWHADTAVERAGRGQALPMRSRLLGVYPTAAEARAACEGQMTTIHDGSMASE